MGSKELFGAVVKRLVGNGDKVDVEVFCENLEEVIVFEFIPADRRIGKT